MPSISSYPTFQLRIWIVTQNVIAKMYPAKGAMIVI